MTTTTTTTSKNNRFNDQNNSSARASRFLVHFFRPLPDYDVKPPNLTFYGGRGRTTSLNKILKNSTPRKVACICTY